MAEKKAVPLEEKDQPGRRISFTISADLDAMLKPYASLMGGDGNAIRALIEQGLRARGSRLPAADILLDR